MGAGITLRPPLCTALKLVGKLYGRDGDSLGRDLSDTGTAEETMKFLDVTSKPKER